MSGKRRAQRASRLLAELPSRACQAATMVPGKLTAQPRKQTACVSLEKVTALRASLSVPYPCPPTHHRRFEKHPSPGIGGQPRPSSILAHCRPQPIPASCPARHGGSSGPREAPAGLANRLRGSPVWARGARASGASGACRRPCVLFPCSQPLALAVARAHTMTMQLLRDWFWFGFYFTPLGRGAGSAV